MNSPEKTSQHNFHIKETQSRKLRTFGKKEFDVTYLPAPAWSHRESVRTWTERGARVETVKRYERKKRNVPQQ